MTREFNSLNVALADRYRLESELGHGGMATVYLAEDLRHQRKVAVKVLRSDLSMPAGAERFLREIRTAAQLNHQHILPLFDSGQVGEQLYYVTPCIVGESLREKLTRETQLTVSEALRICADVAAALDHAHRQGIIHRDIKPENILLQDGSALVADFGIALALSEAAGERLTVTGMTPGTPEYMSPEQASGENIDGRSDVYALACVLYEMLAGKPPYTGATAASVVRQHLAADPPALWSVRGDIPSAVSDGIRKALAKVPADRPATAMAFFSAITSADSQRSSPRKIGAGTVLSSAAVLVGTLAVFFAWLSQTPPSSRPRVGVRPYQNSTGESSLDALGGSLAGTVASALARLETLEAGPVGDPDGKESFTVSGSYSRRGDSLEIVTEIIDRTRNRTLPPPATTRVSVTDPVAAFQTVGEHVSGALAYYTSTFGVVEAPERPPPNYEAWVAFQNGLRHGSSGDLEAAGKEYRRAIEIDPRFTEAYLLLAGMVFLSEQGTTYARGGLPGRYDAIDSLSREMRRAITPVTRIDQVVMDWIDATVQGDLAAALAADFRGKEIFKTMNFGVGFDGVWGNRPQAAVRGLESLNPDLGWLRAWSPYWRFLTGALHLVGDYEAEARAAARWRDRFPQSVAAGVRANIGQGQLDGLVNQIANLSLPVERLLMALELRAHGHNSQADSALAEWIDWYDGLPADRPGPDVEIAAIALALSGRLPDALAIVSSAAQRDTTRLDLKGLLGTLHALAGNREVALAISKQLSTVNERFLLGLIPLWRAKIASQLGARDEAVRLLGDAFAQGVRHDVVFPRRGAYSHTDPAFDSLRNYRPFQDLVRPR